MQRVQSRSLRRSPRHRLRVAGLVDLVGDQLREELEKRYPLPTLHEPSDSSVVNADRSGNVIHIANRQLVELARRADCTLEVVPTMRDFVIKGAPLFRVLVDARGLDRGRLRRLVALSDERTHSGDPAYGFRKLVDVAQRALGTGRTTPPQPCSDQPAARRPAREALVAELT